MVTSRFSMYFDDQYLCDLCGAIRRGVPSYGWWKSLLPPGWCSKDEAHACSHDCLELLGLHGAGHRCLAVHCPWEVPTALPPGMLPFEHVYFIQAGENGPIKIGHTVDVRARLKNLQTAHYETLGVIAWWAGTRDDEAAAHAALATHRIRGEWFHPADEVYRYAMLRLPWPELEDE